MGIGYRNGLLILLMAAALPTAAGCSTLGKFTHGTVLSYLPWRTATTPPPALPYCAEPLFHGYEGTCWRPWPEGWMPCPCAYELEHAEAVPNEELFPPVEILPLEQATLSLEDDGRVVQASGQQPIVRLPSASNFEPVPVAGLPAGDGFQPLPVIKTPVR